MLKKYITKSIYSLYNFVQSGSISKKYNNLKSSLYLDKNYNEDLNKYLLRWGYKSNISENSVQSKTNLKDLAKNVDQKLIHNWAYTGGTYGEPLRVPYSKKRSHIKTATFRFYNEEAGYDLGDPFLLIRAKKRSSFLKFLRNETIFIPFDVSDVQISHLIELLIYKKIKTIIGYPTVIFDIAIYLNKHPKSKKNLKIKSIISVSEPLEQFKKEFIFKIMNCQFIDRYSNEEVGMIAQQKEFGGLHYVNKFGIYVEVIDSETLKPVEEGQQGKVVVTDFFNDLIPVVRYDTGDFATVSEYKDGQLRAITNIVGRQTEQIFSTSGNPISPLILGPYIYKPLSILGNLYQYQFAQVGTFDYELRIKGSRKNINNGLFREIKNNLISILGKKAKLSIIFLEGIKPKPSGKRPVFINEMDIKKS